MPDFKDTGGLHTIFSFFLGLMVTAFVGVGVYAFHPPPQTEYTRQIQEGSRIRLPTGRTSETDPT